MELEDISGFGWDADLDCVVPRIGSGTGTSRQAQFKLGRRGCYEAWDPMIGLSRRLGDMLRVSPLTHPQA